MARRYMKKHCDPDDIIDWLNEASGRRGIATLFASNNDGCRWWIVWEESE